MSVPCYEDDWDYAESRLNNTLVRLGNLPYFVHNICCETGRVEGFLTYEREHAACDLYDLNLEPVPLGYCNTPEGSAYGQRLPTRHYKQGLNGTNYFAKEFRLMADSAHTAKTILGLYPDPMEAAEYVMNKEVKSRAFSRDFALGYKRKDTMSLLFRSHECGTVTWNDEKINLNYHLSDQAQYLQEMLEAATNVQ